MEAQLKGQEGNKLWAQDDLMSTSLHFQESSIFKNIKHVYSCSVQKHFCLGFLLFSWAFSRKKENIKWWLIVLSGLLVMYQSPRYLKILLFGSVLALVVKRIN